MIIELAALRHAHLVPVPIIAVLAISHAARSKTGSARTTRFHREAGEVEEVVVVVGVVVVVVAVAVAVAGRSTSASASASTSTSTSTSTRSSTTTRAMTFLEGRDMEFVRYLCGFAMKCYCSNR